MASIMYYGAFQKYGTIKKKEKKERKTMPKGVRTDYSKGFKLTAVFLMKSGKMRPKEIFELLGGIDRQTVYRWVEEYDKKGEAAFDGKSATSGADVKRLKKDIEELKEENEILKKLSAYFTVQNKGR